jgi:hypothetical protein
VTIRIASHAAMTTKCPDWAAAAEVTIWTQAFLC